MLCGLPASGKTTEAKRRSRRANSQ